MTKHLFSLSGGLAALALLAALPVSAASVSLSWKDNCSSEQGFKIERSTSQTGTYTQVGTVGANVTSYSDTTAAAGATYYYRVRAYNGTWNSGYTNVAAKTVTPSAPASPSATAGAVGSKSITVKWTASSGATSYIVYRASSSTGTYSQVGTATGTSYTNTGLTAGTTYYYKVAAKNAGGTSGQTSYVSAKAQ